MHRDADTTAVDGPTLGESQAPRVLTPGLALRQGRYVLERRLAHGGMAVVWLARDLRLDRPVAIKLLSETLAGGDEYLARFRREARVAARLMHPNLVQVYDFDAEHGRPYLVMEYIDGGTLAERLRAGEEASDPERLARELLAALRHIHASGVLHRDVKPQNVLIGRDGRARLADFGIAKPRDATSITHTGEVIGTERYLAPELIAGRPATERSDLYSLGVLLDEIVAAEGASAALVTLVDELCAVDPEDRPGSAAAALVSLERSRSEASPVGPATEALSARDAIDEPAAERSAGRPAPEPGAIRPARRGPSRLGVLALGGVGLALVVGLALSALLGGDGAPSQRGGSSAASILGGAEGSSSGGGEGSAGSTAEEPEAVEQAAQPPDEVAGGPASSPEPAEGTDGYALNDHGYRLIGAGRYEEAIPVLRQAVDALEGSGDITYAYALYNLGHALRLAGRPEEAIPVLEQRLEIPNQTGVVRKELEAALAATGAAEYEPPKGSSGKPPKAE